MKNKIIISIVVLFVVIIGAIAFFKFEESTNPDSTVWVVPNVLNPYIKIEADNERNNSQEKLNGDNNEMSYYFTIYNFNEETSEYNQIKLTPYVKLELKNDSSSNSFLAMKLYYIKDTNSELSGDNLVEITNMGQDDFNGYFECNELGKYDEQGKENEMHYVVKITLDTESENYIDLENNLNENMKLTLGYKQAD